MENKLKFSFKVKKAREIKNHDIQVTGEIEHGHILSGDIVNVIENNKTSTAECIGIEFPQFSRNDITLLLRGITQLDPQNNVRIIIP
jgi:translation elongation factor EF-Tu-like GTPase